MKEINNCVMCESNQDLNTSMNIKHDKEEYVIRLCDKCADDTTTKMAREALSVRLGQIEALIAQCKALGIEVNVPDGKKIAVPVGPQVAQAPQRRADESREKTKLGNARRIMNTVLPSVSGSAGGTPVEAHQTFNIDDMVGKEIREAKAKGVMAKDAPEPVIFGAEGQQVEGRGGQLMILPKKVQSNMGTTIIKMVDSGGDVALQKRFKDMADESRGRDIRSYENIQDTKCTVCKGTGKARVGDGECPKCSGGGII